MHIHHVLLAFSTLLLFAIAVPVAAPESVPDAGGPDPEVNAMEKGPVGDFYDGCYGCAKK